MKRVIALLLAVLMLAGCTSSGSTISEPVTFYFLRSHTDDTAYDNYFSEGIIGHEEREAAGYRSDLKNLLTFYFRGPLTPELTSPFPMGCRVLEVHQDDSQLTITLNPILAEKSEMDITVACACLAMTCLELTDVDTVQIEATNLDEKILFSRTFTEENLFLSDDYTLPVESTENTQ